MRNLISYCICLVCVFPASGTAQLVRYTDNISGTARLGVVGKSHNYYWFERTQIKKIPGRRGETDQVLTGFLLYDERLRPVKSIPSVASNYARQWLIAGETGLDQLGIRQYPNQTKIYRTHYALSDTPTHTESVVDSLLFRVSLSRMLLVRSEDRSKMMLLAFENSDADTPRIHVLLLDAELHLLRHSVISSENLAQPCIQEDEISFPIEPYDDLPVKLANNGSVTMGYPSRTSPHFCVFHILPNGIDYYERELILSPFYHIEEIAMTLDNWNGEMSIGLLSGYKNTTLKNVQVFDYSMNLRKLIFDSSYRFNSQAREIKNKNLSHQKFISVPGGGYMLLKEYGSPYESDQPVEPVFDNSAIAYMLSSYSEIPAEKSAATENYHLHPGLHSIPAALHRGDLNMYYFPGYSKDSAWTGIIDMEQQSEANNPELSYLMLPKKNALYLLYNSASEASVQLATAHILSLGGRPLDQGLVFWKVKQLLNFQESRRFSPTEVAIPYRGPFGRGCAILSL